ncbi:MAG: 16S rRNA (adenine(1518)-N(6)/adenine(1519)-N(6))-dimethyltransferase RsmA [Candidatus Nomurabacteria bacterium]|nr:16S rRNA (adenine(1518)-N(6)/adenine(1519)-N(6))-dimethyltransferase RsmA [Candidatus Nomurabacteria bacterium]
MKNDKSLGQHWLKDRGVLAEIAGYGAEVAGENTVALEIGPGLGTLTSALLRRFRWVVAVEYDKRLADNLPKQFVGANLTVVNADFLTFDLTKMQDYGVSEGGESVSDSGGEGDYVVVANIPYYITAKIIQKLVEAKKPPKRAVLLVQKEVAERIAGGAGEWSANGGGRGKSSLLSLMVAERAAASLGLVVGREYFTPPPKVDSQVLILDFGAKKPMSEAENKRFWRVVRAGFSSPRKKLAKNLAAVGSKERVAEAFAELKINENARAEDLDFATWRGLAAKLG